MGRRWGKSVMAGALALACATRGASVAWVVPTYKNARPVWRFIQQMLTPLRGTVDLNKTDRTATFPSGGWIGVYSADNDVGLRGEAFDLVIVDEAAAISEETYTDVIQPTLADRDGRCILISTPKGRNWFWREWIRGQDEGEPDVASWTAPSNANPNPNIRRAYERARTAVSGRTFEQEWNARFLEDGGMVFRRVRECVVKGEWPKEPYKGEFVIGLDWGRENDFTVATVVEASNTRPRVVEIDRFNKIDWAFQRERVKALYRKWGAQVIVAEKNSIGDPNIEALVDDDIPVVPFVTTNATKGRLIEKLVVAIENREIELPDYPVLLNELEAYEMGRTALGMVTYNAPEGSHDDCVISLALGYMGAHDASGSFIS